MLKSFTLALTATSFLAFPVAPASASNLGKAIVGAGALAIIGCASGALNCRGNRTTQKRYYKKKTYISPAQQAQRAENKLVQSALNAFGFNVGGADGVLGKNSRRGISNYQASLGYPATGYLNDEQAQFLLDSHRRIMASTGYGDRDILRKFHNERNNFGNAGYSNQNGYNNGAQNTFVQQGQPNNGYANPNAPQYNNGTAAIGGPVPVAPQVVTPGGTQVYAATAGTVAPAPQVVIPAPQAVAPAAAAAAVATTVLPSLKPKPAAPTSVSMAQRCEFVDVLTESNGITLASNISDPDQALSEQFCGMRTAAIADAEKLMSDYGVQVARMRDEICGPVSLEMAGAVSATVQTAPLQVAAQAGETTRKLGISDAQQARDYGRMCLGVGYSLDDPAMAMGGAMMLLGEEDYTYSEVVGHHLREGFTTAADANAADPWYRKALSALDGGATPAFMPAQSAEREKILRGALDMGAARAANGTLPGVVAVKTGPVLPILTRQ